VQEFPGLQAAAIAAAQADGARLVAMDNVYMYGRGATGGYQYRPGSGKVTRDGSSRRPGSRLRLVGAVVAVPQAQRVPVRRRVQVTKVDDVDLDLRSLRDPQGRTGDRAVVLPRV